MAPHVVVCDDEAHITRVIALKLDRAGFEVHTASDAETAWELIERTQPALVIAEDKLSGMSGWDLIERLRTTQDYFDTACIVMTSTISDLPEAEQHAEELHVQAVIAKPFSTRSLVTLAKSLVPTVPVRA
jgi:DNA-binding response OmpR family regulator